MGHERSPNEVYLAFLPLAHIFEITQEIIVLSLGIKVGYSSPSTLTDSSPGIVPGQLGDISVLKPTVMAAVPIILDRIYKSLRCVLDNNYDKNSVWNSYLLVSYFQNKGWAKRTDI
jgi:long-subunit acyl-CoA synthetase (AMP-forming)